MPAEMFLNGRVELGVELGLKPRHAVGYAGIQNSILTSVPNAHPEMRTLTWEGEVSATSTDGTR